MATENGSGIVGMYPERQAAREKWLADEKTVAKGETVKQLLREIKAAQPETWRLFLAAVTMDEMSEMPMGRSPRREI